MTIDQFTEFGQHASLDVNGAYQIYRGQMKDSLPNGLGIQYDLNNIKVGFFKNGVFDGFGRIYKTFQTSNKDGGEGFFHKVG
jgi:hypothetical protein